MKRVCDTRVVEAELLSTIETVALIHNDMLHKVPKLPPLSISNLAHTNDTVPHRFAMHPLFKATLELLTYFDVQFAKS